MMRPKGQGMGTGLAAAAVGAWLAVHEKDLISLSGAQWRAAIEALRNGCRQVKQFPRIGQYRDPLVVFARRTKPLE